LCNRSKGTNPIIGERKVWGRMIWIKEVKVKHLIMYNPIPATYLSQARYFEGRERQLHTMELRIDIQYNSSHLYATITLHCPKFSLRQAIHLPHYCSSHPCWIPPQYRIGRQVDMDFHHLDSGRRILVK
jgi:hypothetical protein